jgi:hypothetical protein
VALTGRIRAIYLPLSLFGAVPRLLRAAEQRLAELGVMPLLAGELRN